MRLELALLADDAALDREGKLHIFAEFQAIFAPELPARHGRCAIVARFLSDASSVTGKHSIQVELVDEDGNSTGVPPTPTLNIRFMPLIGRPQESRALFVMKLDGLILSKYGRHSIHFIVDKERVGVVQFDVLKPPQSPKAAS